MVVPSLWSFALGTLAAWRIYKLLADDAILDRPRDFLAERSRFVEKLLACPYCLGFWISLLGTSGYYLVAHEWHGWPVAYGFLVTTFAMSGVLVFVEILLDLVVAKKDVAEVDAGHDE